MFKDIGNKVDNNFFDDEIDNLQSMIAGLSSVGSGHGDGVASLMQKSRADRVQNRAAGGGGMNEE